MVQTVIQVDFVCVTTEHICHADPVVADVQHLNKWPFDRWKSRQAAISMHASPCALAQTYCLQTVDTRKSQLL